MIIKKVYSVKMLSKDIKYDKINQIFKYGRKQYVNVDININII